MGKKEGCMKDRVGGGGGSGFSEALLGSLVTCIDRSEKKVGNINTNEINAAAQTRT